MCIRKLIVIVHVSVLSFSLNFISIPEAYAQSGLEASVSIQVSANVQSAETEIEVVTTRGMDLRGVERGVDVVNIDPTVSFRAGKFVVSGEPRAEFRVSYVPTRELSNLEGTGFLFFDYEVSGNDLDEQDTSELFQPETPSLQFNENGDFYIWVGGRVNLENAAPGTYEGEFTLEIEYI